MGTLRRLTPESSPQLGDTVPRADRGEGCVLPEAKNTTNDFAPTDPGRILRAAPGVADSSRLAADRLDLWSEGHNYVPGMTQAMKVSASGTLTGTDLNHEYSTNLPVTVKAAARFLGVSPQTVYLWVE